MSFCKQDTFHFKGFAVVMDFHPNSAGKLANAHLRLGGMRVFIDIGKC